MWVAVFRKRKVHVVFSLHGGTEVVFELFSRALQVDDGVRECAFGWCLFTTSLGCLGPP